MIEEVKVQIVVHCKYGPELKLIVKCIFIGNCRDGHRLGLKPGFEIMMGYAEEGG